MAPWFARMEARLVDRAVGSGAEREQRGARARRAQARHRHARRSARNVKGCANLGYCGMGCPTNAKQSMLVTTIPAALARGATLVTRVRAQRLRRERDRVTRLEARRDGRGRARRRRRARSPCARAPTSPPAGAIGTPALLLRSDVPDPHGARRQAHVPASDRALGRARCRERVDGFAGAPQSIYSDHFLDTLPIDGPIGFKLEAPPMHPLLTATTLPDDGEAHARWMREFRRMHVADRAAARRLPPREPRRHRAPARRRHAGARLSADALRLGRRAPRLPRDGRDPVRRGRDARVPVHGDGHRVHELRRRARRRSTRSTCARLYTPRRLGARDGRRAVRRRSAPRGRSTMSRPPPSAANLYVSTDRCSRRRSAPIRSCPIYAFAAQARGRPRAAAGGPRRPARTSLISVIRSRRLPWSIATSAGAVDLRDAYAQRFDLPGEWHDARIRSDPQSRSRRRRRVQRLAPGLAREPRRRRRHARLGADGSRQHVPQRWSRKAPLVESRTFRLVGDRLEGSFTMANTLWKRARSTVTRRCSRPPTRR